MGVGWAMLACFLLLFDRRSSSRRVLLIDGNFKNEYVKSCENGRCLLSAIIPARDPTI